MATILDQFGNSVSSGARKFIRGADNGGRERPWEMVRLGDIDALVPCSLSSVNSCRACLVRQGYRIIEVDFETVQWSSGTTRRARRQLINPVDLRERAADIGERR